MHNSDGSRLNATPKHVLLDNRLAWSPLLQNLGLSNGAASSDDFYVFIPYGSMLKVIDARSGECLRKVGPLVKTYRLVLCPR